LAKTWDLKSLERFSEKQGLLSTTEDRRRVRQELLKTNHFNVVSICLEAGQEIPSRPEPYGVCFYVIGGKGVFSVGSEEFKLSFGNMIYIQACESRGIRSLERLTLLGIQDPH